MGDLNDFGRIIAEERKKRGMTQDELAAALSITPQAVSKWENGVGLPDVTLFPKIAEALGVPIERLFGANKGAISEFPEKINGLPFICSRDGVACFSDKIPDKADSKKGYLVTFKDGSTADLEKQTAVNTGAGEIRIIKYSECERGDYKAAAGGATSYDRDFGAFRSLSVSMSISGNVRIHRGGPAGRVTAAGTELFISLIDARRDGDCLNITVNSENNQGGVQRGNAMDVYTGFERGNELKIKVNGSSDFLCEPDFGSVSLGINGSGDIKTAGAGCLDAKINGSGDIEAGVAGSIIIKINGSGDFKCVSAKNASLMINGSGDIKIGRPEGNINLKISGSGDLECGEGSVDKLTVSVTGSGNVAAERLTAREAEIEIKGGADITIGRIVERSVEKLSKSSTLKVLRRG